MGGHLVSGHVDGIGRVVERHGDARSIRFQIQAPDALAKYIAHKGSICVDGTSLTVNAVDGSRFELNIVPHTLQETIMEAYRPGTEVNLEVDLIARYLEPVDDGRAGGSSGRCERSDGGIASVLAGFCAEQSVQIKCLRGFDPYRFSDCRLGYLSFANLIWGMKCKREVIIFYLSCFLYSPSHY